MMAEAVSTKLLLSTTRPGPFISGSTHSILSLGQRPLIESLTEEEQEAVDDKQGSSPAGANATSPTSSRGRGRGRGRGWSAASRKARSGGVPTLQDLIEAGIIIPGRNNITVSYKGTTYTASLEKDGSIAYQGKPFHSATSFSIHCKRMQTPNKQGDDGWKSVLYEGQPLEMYRRKYSGKPRTPQPRRNSASAQDGDEEMASAEQGGRSEAGTPTPNSKTSGAEAAAADPETEQWVQCDRCRTWRVVPGQHWPALEADSREDWFCEYAQWNVTLSHPFTPSCVA